MASGPLNQNTETLIGSELYLSRTWAVHSSLQHQFLLRGEFSSHLSKCSSYTCCRGVPSMVTSASISGHTQISGLVPLFLSLPYIPGGSHSQQVTYSPPPPLPWKTLECLFTAPPSQPPSSGRQSRYLSFSGALPSSRRSSCSSQSAW